MKNNSIIAKEGYENERECAVKFENYKHDIIAQKALIKMGIDWENINDYSCFTIPSRLTDSYNYNYDVSPLEWNESKTYKKADIIMHLEFARPEIERKIIRISCKNNTGVADANSFERRTWEFFLNYFDFDDRAKMILKGYFGVVPPSEIQSLLIKKLPLLRDRQNVINKNVKNKCFNGNEEARRIYLDEVSNQDRKNIVETISKKSDNFIDLCVRGRGEFQSDYLLITKERDLSKEYHLISSDSFIKHTLNGETEITKEGNLAIGKATIQRKGGEDNKKSNRSNDYQVKIKMREIIDGNKYML